MDQQALSKILAKAQKFGNLMDGTTAEFNEFAEQFVKHLNEIKALIDENATLKAKIAELEKTATPATTEARPAAEIAKAMDAQNSQTSQ